MVLGLSACSIDDVGAILQESGSNEGSEGEKEDVTVNRVIDGDTIEVEMPNGANESVRLLLIDTPESVHPDKPDQPYGEEASEYVKEKLSEGTEIKLEYDGTKRGQYDRLLAYIWVDGDNLNQELIEKGFARYAYEYDPPYKYQDEFKESEKEAEKEEKNIWSINGYVESEFEK